MTCPTISAALRFLLKPILPSRRTASHAAADLRGDTESDAALLGHDDDFDDVRVPLVTRASFVEPSREDLSSAIGMVSRENISEKTLLKLLGMFVISRKSRLPWL